MAAIQTQGLTKRFGDSVYAVDGVDMTVEEGEVFGFLGPNGAGKSTTINILLDFLRPTSGQASVFGYDTQAETVAVREHIGVLPEGYDLYGRLTGREHVELAVDLKEADDDPDAVLERVGLTLEEGSRRASGYSQGMRQRLTLGMALVGNPELLILDEPTNGLDPNGARMMREIVEEHAAAGGTVFFSSHILEQVEAVCDRVAIIRAGQLVALDTIDGLRDEVGTGETLDVYVDRVPRGIADQLAALSGVSTVEPVQGRVRVTCTDAAVKIAVLDRLRDEGARIEDFTTEEASLEELFAAYTDRRAEVTP
jgi:ABC-2 type transport system ATP-binding protein